MRKNWFQLSESGAGEKRLILSFYLYKIFGKNILRIIAFFVVLITFFKAKDRRKASEKFFKILGRKNILLDSWIQFINYGNSLVDKILSFLGDFDNKNFVYEDSDFETGVFYLTTHIGNVEILRSLLEDYKNTKVNVFLQANVCEIFRKFLNTFEKKVALDTFPIEEINLNTSILISEKLKQGENVFMAGDRISAQNADKIYKKTFLGKTISLPLGVIRFALMLEAPIRFILCVKEGKKYRVIIEKFIPTKTNKSEIIEELENKYVEFLEKYTLKYPHQFYNFFDIWEE